MLTILAFPRGTSPYNDCFYRSVEAQGVRVIDGIYAGRWLRDHLSDFKIVHLHWPSFYYYCANDTWGNWLRLTKLAVFLLSLKCLGKRIVWTAHNLYPHEGGSELRVHRVGRWLMRILANNVLVHGRLAGKLVSSRLSIAPHRIVRIEHGHWIGYYPNDCSREAARLQLDLPQDRTVFLFLGLALRYKNLEFLLETFQKLHSKSFLVIAGKFPDTEYYAAVQRVVAQNPERISIHPFYVEAKDVQIYLNAADCVVLPYTEVLTSGAAMLSLSFGKPVIAPRLGCLEEVISQSCGRLYDTTVQNGLLEAMTSFDAGEFDCNQILSEAQKYSWDRSAATFIETCYRAKRKGMRK